MLKIRGMSNAATPLLDAGSCGAAATIRDSHHHRPFLTARASSIQRWPTSACGTAFADCRDAASIQSRAVAQRLAAQTPRRPGGEKLTGYLPRYDDSLFAARSRIRLRCASPSDTTGTASARTANQRRLLPRISSDRPQCSSSARFAGTPLGMTSTTSSPAIRVVVSCQPLSNSMTVPPTSERRASSGEVSPTFDTPQCRAAKQVTA